MITLDTAAVTEIALLAAHCDDLAIGMGGTLLTLADAVAGLRVRALILTGGDTERAEEERLALESFCPGADLDLRILDLPDGSAPAHWERAKAAVAALRRDSAAQLVFAPQRGTPTRTIGCLRSWPPPSFATI